MTARRSGEAFWWSLFSAGGVLSALFLPVLVVVCGVVLTAPAYGGRSSYHDLLRLVSWWPVRAFLFVVILFSFFHAAHRIRHVIMDLGWRHATAPLWAGCYGGALAGAAAAAWVLLRLGAPV